jgi:hypothetical protein
MKKRVKQLENALEEKEKELELMSEIKESGDKKIVMVAENETLVQQFKNLLDKNSQFQNVPTSILNI